MVCGLQRPWHILYFLPLPQKQGSLRPGVFSARTGVMGAGAGFGATAAPRVAVATGDGVGPSGERHTRFRSWKEDLRDAE